MDPERQALTQNAFLYVARNYTYSALHMKWPQVVRELEQHFNTTFTGIEVAFIIYFFNEAEPKNPPSWARPTTHTNRT